MSASLVGSEMCIRDRSSAPGMQSLERTHHVVRRAFGAFGPQGCAGDVPVSYTHLTLPTICSV
eukprot:14766314-Alexandrium_andersonii.AAC.1